MVTLQTFIPIIMPDSSSGPSGPWTPEDTKMAVTITVTCIVAGIIVLIANWIHSKLKGYDTRLMDLAKPLNSGDEWFLTVFLGIASFLFVMSWIFFGLGYLINALIW